MAVLFTSDLHLGHKNILVNRTQFTAIEQHDDFLIEQWNAKVRKQDEVYILGDFSYRASPQEVCTFLERLIGRKHLIVGNHDGYWMKKMQDKLYMYFETIDSLKVIKLDHKNLTLCHYPMLEWSGSNYVEAGKSYLIHGHIHASTDPKVYGYIQQYQPHALNAGVDINGFCPCTFEELKANNAVWYGR